MMQPSSLLRISRDAAIRVTRAKGQKTYANGLTRTTANSMELLRTRLLRLCKITWPSMDSDNENERIDGNP